ncbi:hypothetical protein [Metabacillus fastidiosus]|uniref:hypothetical protein n=1 Tax=Metabacillus fastidiosus TaxID=1458 RepID=UPI002E1F3A70|nr:hypothetical protein [Metabacillus fastidiosus]
MPRKNYKDPEWVDERPLNKELKEDLTLVFNLLIKFGADVNEVDPRTGKSLLEYNQQEYVAQFLQD